jgi:holo-[acyl-carrier protein] synthase
MSRAAKGEPATAARVGLDLVDMDRFRQAMARHPLLVERLFTPAEIAYCRGRAKPELHFAARFAAKEAVGKLLGFGVTGWTDIEVKAESPGGPPQVTLTGRAVELATQRGIAEVSISLSHVDSLAGACAVAVACSWGGADDGSLLA